MLPWNIPEEYQQFLGHVAGHIVLIGRTSHEIFGCDLKGATSLVLSRTVSSLPGVEVFSSLESAMCAASGFPGDLFCAGGGEVYRQTIHIAQRMVLSYVKGSFQGDTFFPDFSRREWLEVRRKCGPLFDLVEFRRSRGETDGRS
jgi:dihydrofolate reductase